METANYYERYWSTTGFHPQRRSNPGLTKLIATHVPPGSRLIDVGCGNASICNTCLPQGYEYRGVDVSENAVAEARSAGVNAVRIQDAGQLPFEDASFDAALCLEVFEHLFQPQLVAKEILRVLRPGGVLIATVPNVAYWRRRLELMFGRWNPLGDDLSVKQPWRDPHLRFFTQGSLQRMLSSGGFNPVTTSGHSTEYADYAIETRGLRKIYFKAHSSKIYQRLEAGRPSMFALRLHAVAVKPGSVESLSSDE